MSDPLGLSPATTDPDNPCQACGACCSYSSNWPRFTIEDDAALDLIPAELVNDRLSGMRCEGERCAALARQGRGCDRMHHLRDPARGLPDLHARRR